MHIRFLFPGIIVALMIFPAWAEDVITSDDGPVTLRPEVEQDIHVVPIDEDTGTVDWSEYLKLNEGGGAKFGFITVLYPPDPAALYNIPDILLDSAWRPPVPFAFGYSPPLSGQVSTRGWWYLEDATGNLGRRDMDVGDGNSSIFCSTWFLGGNSLYHVEENWNEGFFTEINYLPDDWEGGGIDYFLRNVWFRGILSGERMQNLLNICGAVRFGRSPIEGGRDHLVIFQISPNETDRQNGRGSLLVWTTVGDWRLVRTRLHTVYATEVTEYASVLGNVQNDPNVYYYEWLPENIYWAIDHYLLTRQSPFWGIYTEEVFDPSTYEPSLPEGSSITFEKPDEET
ncbi:MAG TPA: hypothetical protein ENN67_02215, partial [Firmicutes bacterium]|nr:hypothetical protein [Bacillota bacterium]